MLNMPKESDYWQLSSKITSVYNAYGNENKIHLSAFFLIMLGRIIHFN